MQLRLELRRRSSISSGSGSSGSDGSGGGRGIREAVGAISRASRRRLREAVWSVQPAMLPRLVHGGRWVRPASFVTLTYAAEDLPRHIEDPRLSKRHLDAFFKALSRAYPGSWAIWVLEFQANGNAHFHLVVCWGTRGARAETWFATRAWVASTWSAIVAVGREGDDDGTITAKNCRVGTAVDPLITGEALARYVTKAGSKKRPAVPVGVAVAGELAKRAQKHVRIQGQGRWWGVLNRKGYESAVSVVEVELPSKVAWRVWYAVREDWQRFYESQGKVVGNDEDADIKYLPRWLTAERATSVLRGLGESDALWSSPAVDVNTGESWDQLAPDEQVDEVSA